MYGHPSLGINPDFKTDDSNRLHHCPDCLTRCHDCPHFPPPMPSLPVCQFGCTDSLECSGLCFKQKPSCEGCE